MSRARRIRWGIDDPDDGPDERPVAGTCQTCQADMTADEPHQSWCPEEDQA